MLNLLHIENIAVIEQAEIIFDRGLNVLTGETGAGKSIVIDAISAILGERAYRDLIRTGCTRASVSAVFSGIPELDWFREKQIPFDPDELLIQREICADGRNLCRVNGAPVTVSILRELGRNLINIHGQNDTATLFDEQTHLGYLDAMAADPAPLAAYLQAYADYTAVKKQVEKLSMDESERLRRIETLRYQVQEIEKAALKPGEDEQIESRRRILMNAEKLSGGLSAAVDALYGDDSREGAADLLSAACRELDRLAAVDERYAELSSSLTELRYNVQELSEDLRSELEDLSFSADELENLENRLDIIRKLRKKYGATVQDVLEYAEKSRAELETIELSDEALEDLKKTLEIRKKTADSAAEVLRNERSKTARFLQKRMEEELAQLGMPNIRFVVEFEQIPICESGADLARFLMSANLGEALKPLSKVASGGELARIMLAMKNVLAEKDRVPTLIFDEVDAGVSGRAAQKVAEKLLAVSRGKQVLCVTHLPQIAAMADSHLLIAKSVRAGRTFTNVTPLDRDGRITELARIIGGTDITENTRRSAAEMLRS